MTRYAAHLTDDWQRDSVVIQVREQTNEGHTTALGQTMEDVDGQPVLTFQTVPWQQHADPWAQHADQVPLDPMPGLRVRWEAAVAIGQAIIAHTKAPADPGEVQDLRDDLEGMTLALRDTQTALALATMERDAARESVVHLERHLEATAAHLEREARVATLGLREAERDQAQADHEQERRFHPARSVQFPAPQFPVD